MAATSTASAPAVGLERPAAAVTEEPASMEGAGSLLEDAQRVFAENRDRLLSAIDATSSILSDLRGFNKDRWIVHYPQLAEVASAQPSSENTAEKAAAPTLRRTKSVAGEEELVAEEGAASSASSEKILPRPTRQMSYADGAEASQVPKEEEDETASELQVLRIDLKLGPTGSDPQALVRTLEKSSVASLLDGRMSQALKHLLSLRARISDTSSKVLVTGDLNAGKSTFVNALLRREVMPVDQQPCTTVFAEVLDAAEMNEGVEEVHVVTNVADYDRSNEKTFERHSISHLESLVTDYEADPSAMPILKVYVHDRRQAQTSLLRNGVVDISLIDAPGLNRDSLKTTALFARQEEIDVVVFVVSAENHFTLSAKEFLWSAGNEKAYVFIIVNKFDAIRDKERCKRLVLEQVRQLSPHTFEDAEDLVHFVESANVVTAESAPNSVSVDGAAEAEEAKEGVQVEDETASTNPAFAAMEEALRNFVLVKRSKSKLLPAQTYLTRLLGDVGFLARSNALVASSERDAARAALEEARPALEKCLEAQVKLEGVLEGEEDEAVREVEEDAREHLAHAIEMVGRGLPANDNVKLPPYPGLLSLWTYAQEVRLALLNSLEAAVRKVEDETRKTTAEAVKHVQDLGKKHLPEESAKDTRVFVPEAMFARRRQMNSRRVGVVGFVGLGLGSEIVEVNLSDLFDISHHLSFGESSDGKGKDNEEEMSLISTLGIGLGAMTVVGGKTFGAHSIIEAVVRISDILGNQNTRRWAGPVIAVASVGLAVYFVLDLPNSVPRNVGRSLRRTLLNPPQKEATSSRRGRRTDALVPAPNKNVAPSATFADLHAARVSRETRKVLRLAGWDLSERFRVAIDERKKVVHGEEEKERSAIEALAWFEEVILRTEKTRESVGSVH